MLWLLCKTMVPFDKRDRGRTDGLHITSELSSAIAP